MRRFGRMGSEPQVERDIGSLGVGIAGLAGAFDAEPPRDRSYDDETTNIFNAQKRLAPERFDLEQQYGGKYTGLAAQNLYDLLFGREGSVEQDPKGGTRQVSGSPSLLDMLDEIAKRNRAAATADRGANLADVEQLAPQVAAGYRAGDPQGAALLDAMTASAQQRLDSGMSPGELRDVQQAIRAGQASRGVGYGPRDVWEEVYGTGLQSRQLQQENMNSAAQSLALRRGFYGDPFQLILNQGGGGAAAQAQLSPLSSLLTTTAGPKYFNPESGYGNAIYGQNYQGQLQTNLLNAQMAAKYADMTAKGGDSIGKALAMGI